MVRISIFLGLLPLKLYGTEGCPHKRPDMLRGRRNPASINLPKVPNIHPTKINLIWTHRFQYAVEASPNFTRSIVMVSCVTIAHAHQCCIFQSYAKTVPSRMKLTMRETASMTMDTWSRRVTSDFNSAYLFNKNIWKNN